MQKQAGLMMVHALLAGDPQLKPTQEQKRLVDAVRGIFQKYDLDKDGILSKEEARPYIINFNHLVFGFTLEMSNDDEWIDQTYAKFGGLEHNGIIPVALFINLDKTKEKGSIDNATKEAPAY